MPSPSQLFTSQKMLQTGVSDEIAAGSLLITVGGDCISPTDEVVEGPETGKVRCTHAAQGLLPN